MSSVVDYSLEDEIIVDLFFIVLSLRLRRSEILNIEDARNSDISEIIQIQNRKTKLRYKTELILYTLHDKKNLTSDFKNMLYLI